MVCLAFRADRVDGLAAGESTGYYVYDKPQSIFFLHYLYQNGRNFCFFLPYCAFKAQDVVPMSSTII